MNTAPRSAFVTATAWSFIVASAFTTVVSLLQNVMVWTMFDSAAFERVLATDTPGEVPELALSMFRHMPLISVAVLLLSALSLAASIGLLRRRNWARLVFMAMMVLGIAWNLLGLALQFAMMGHMRELMADVPPDAPDVGFLLVGIGLMSAVMALGFSAVFGWIFLRLRSPAVVAEFQAEAAGTRAR